jgi:hypothetical protein
MDLYAAPAHTIITLLALTIGCTAPQADGDLTINYAEDLVPDHEVSEMVPTVVEVNWSTDVEGTAYVEFGTDGAFDRVTPLTDAASGKSVLLGLSGDDEVEYRVIIDTEDGESVVSRTGEVALDTQPSNLPAITITEYDPDRMQEGGYLLMTFLLSSAGGYTAVMDRNGDFVWYVPADENKMVVHAEPSKDGNSILMMHQDGMQASDVGSIARIAMDGSERINTRTILGHHDFVEHDDGFGFLSLDLADATMDGEPAQVAADVILEVEEGADDDTPTREVINFLDSYKEPTTDCPHQQMNAYGTTAYDWTHMNSIMYDPLDEAYFVQSKLMNTLFKVDRESGEILWEMGGLDSDFTAIGDDVWWTHGHLSHIWKGGMVLFDNNYHNEPEEDVSRIVEYAFDEETRTVEKVFDYYDPEDRFIPMIGDVKKLPNGNYLVSWTTLGMINEITPDGDVVWQAEAELGSVTTRVTWVEDLYTLH